MLSRGVAGIGLEGQEQARSRHGKNRLKCSMRFKSIVEVVRPKAKSDMQMCFGLEKNCGDLRVLHFDGAPVTTSPTTPTSMLRAEVIASRCRDAHFSVLIFLVRLTGQPSS